METGPLTLPPSKTPSLRARIFSTDHRVIARQYFFLSLFAVILGIVLSLLMRFHLVWPQAKVSWFEQLWPVRAEGGVMTPELYLSLMTLHGTIMVFFVLTLAPFNAFSNLVLPEQLGSREMAFPRLNMMSFWTTLAAFFLLVASFVCRDGGPIAGWTAYPPLSAVGAIAGPGEGLGQTLWFFSIGVFCVASLLAAMNIISTIIECRAPGMSLMQMPITCWNWFVTAILSVLSFPVLMAAAMLILLDRLAGTSFFLPSDLLVADQNLAHSGVLPCSGSTCSGSSDTPRFTLPSCPAWASFRTSFPTSRAARHFPTARRSLLRSRSRSSACWSGVIICSPVASALTAR